MIPLFCGVAPGLSFREVGGHICVWSLLLGLPGPPSGGDVPGGVGGGEGGDEFPCVGEGLVEEGVGSASVSAVVFLFGSFVSEGSGAWFAVVHGGVLSGFSYPGWGGW